MQLTINEEGRGKIKTRERQTQCYNSNDKMRDLCIDVTRLDTDACTHQNACLPF